ncbi:F0F1 ATP synthase subunit delta [Ottowia sp. SB7-C50]|jgi:F-type H+-transporting ATPase subunit delta|uniref:F0F1 ATP synthase subunit delta n=1 Tax=Ottowia sp. SB7-C50 TaxID=3081231 RepID=UPI002954F9BB|nr:F0F1 ATP synthase subunit delta [Ottowia sp. SB7-C50]WOP15318.1 F0F1 ATP synthase subunit delta [Ottowia sp. SB7-C50]
MAELATIARPYAEALFQTSRSELGATQGWLDGLAAAAGNAQLLQFAANPKVDAGQVFQVVTSVLKAPLPERGVNFLRTVIDNDRLAALPEVARQYRQLANAVGGSSDAVVYTAFPISDADMASLIATLEQRFGRKLNASQQTDPSLIGGVRVVVGDEVLDTSVKARLEQMKMALTA